MSEQTKPNAALPPDRMHLVAYQHLERIVRYDDEVEVILGQGAECKGDCHGTLSISLTDAGAERLASQLIRALSTTAGSQS